MLIYDHNKEFVGIDDESLKLLGYSRFEDLLHEHKDVAELFVKKPGYIHNFTNFPWIDFILHAESEEAKVIIAGKSNAFSATIDITKLHLTKAPDEEAYLIKLKNVQNYQLDASERPAPTPPPIDLEAKSFNTPQEMPKAAAQPVIEAEPPVEQPPLTLDEDLFIKEEPIVEEETVMPFAPSKTPDDEEFDIFFDDEEELFAEPEPELPPLPKSVLDNLKEEKSTPMLGAQLSEEDKEYLKDLEFSDDYLYDPQIAADELGLPVDLIEEFIGDFIKQAHEFKEQLFNAIKNEDFDTIKVLSHKLKGVAANLRIEDSFEVLRNVNESADAKECEANLKKFYLTIAKLEGKDIEEVKFELDKQEEEEELYDLTPKFNEPNVEEEIFPTLDLPELEPQEDQAPVIQEHIAEPSIVEPEQDQTSDIYDFGLIQKDTDEPLIFMDNEDEVISDIQDFEPQTEAKETAPLLTFDIKRAAAEIGLSTDLVTALIDDYIIEANEMKNKLTEAVEADDAMRWKGYATQLKGVSDNLRIKDISDTLLKLISSTDKIQAKAVMKEFYGFINQL
ncbi:Hpt domain-containing protein [Sulfurimonas sp. HSL3-7]|uniref:Hpt domain-containing protein n=1 Tax=Sulfonitrofixus jiaomeiensis TaxID=3131938 RepID=UPI0031F99A02